jgi:hypothetical protein
MSTMAARMRRVLVLAKRSAHDMYVARHQDPTFTRLMSEPQVNGGFSFLVHELRAVFMSFARLFDV